MFTNFPFFPQQASEQAANIDALYFFLVAVTGFFMALIGRSWWSSPSSTAGGTTPRSAKPSTGL